MRLVITSLASHNRVSDFALVGFDSSHVKSNLLEATENDRSFDARRVAMDPLTEKRDKPNDGSIAMNLNPIKPPEP